MKKEGMDEEMTVIEKKRVGLSGTYHFLGNLV
jgi:hypothetical protein